MKVKLGCSKCEDGTIVFEVNPGYAPTPCSDPDHPAYSDPGCGPEVVDFELCNKCGAEPTDEDEKYALGAEPEDDWPEPDEDYRERSRGW